MVREPNSNPNQKRLATSKEINTHSWQIVPANRCGYIKMRALFTYEVPLCVALKSMTN
jgi:hypothetical protein